MRRPILFFILLLSLQVHAQEKEKVVATDESKAVKIFNSDKAINANTTETVGKGKMAFRVSHNFGDIAGKNGGIRQFFGLDNSTDIRIAFETGLGKRFDLITARSKGASLQQQLWELGFKYKVMEQRYNDATHPISVAIIANAVVASNKSNSFPNQENTFEDFGDRLSNLLQVVIAKKVGNISLQLNPTVVTRGYTISYDQKTFFAIGGAICLPIVKNRFNLIADYFHPFRRDEVKDSFRVNDNIRFYDPLGIGFEFITSGHSFRLNFTNTTEILENRFIPRTISSWGKGQFRWAFTISRTFTVWRKKQ